MKSSKHSNLDLLNKINPLSKSEWSESIQLKQAIELQTKRNFRKDLEKDKFTLEAKKAFLTLKKECNKNFANKISVHFLT